MCAKMYSLGRCLGYNTLIIHLIFLATCNGQIPYDISQKQTTVRNSNEVINDQVHLDTVLNIERLLEDYVNGQQVTGTIREQRSGGKEPETTAKSDVEKFTVTSKLSTLLIPKTSPSTTSGNAVSINATQPTTNTAASSTTAETKSTTTAATTAATTTNNKVLTEDFLSTTSSGPLLTTNSTTPLKPNTTSSGTSTTAETPVTNKTRIKKELTTTKTRILSNESAELLTRCKLMRMTGFPLPRACFSVSDFWS